MKFLVDAHLPPGLCAFLGGAGHDPLHTRGLPAQNQTPDQAINDLSVKVQRNLKRLFEAHLPAIVRSLETHSLVELHRQSVRVVA